MTRSGTRRLQGLSLLLVFAACARAPTVAPGRPETPPAAAATPAPASMEQALSARAKAIAACVAADPAEPTGVFDDKLGASLPRLLPLLKQFHQRYGAVRAVVAGETLPDDGQRFDLAFENGTHMPMRLYVEATSPFRVSGLWFDKPVEPAAAAPSDAKAELRKALVERANAVARLVAAEPAIPPGLFDDEMMKVIGEVTPDLKALFEDAGAVREAKFVGTEGAQGGRFQFVFGDTRKPLPVRIYVEAAAPFRVSGLWFDEAVHRVKSFDEVVAELRNLPGRVSFAACKLGVAPGEGAPVAKVPPLDLRDIDAVASLDADQPLAIGSTFKLYILGGLMDQVRQGKHRWDELLRLDARWRSLPSGELHRWPAKAAFTIESLAGLMISRSDNTATDHLLYTVGREKVEAMLAPMGNHHADRNKPFLATADAFRLKNADSKSVADAYVAANVPQRRKLLETDVAKVSLASVTPPIEPYLVDSVEWYASAADLCRAMDWLRRASGEAAKGRALLAINVPGVRDGEFAYAGYKGGSEPGVLNMTWLVQSHDGTWWALSMGWNNEKPVDTGKLLSLGRGALELLANGAK